MALVLNEKYNYTGSYWVFLQQRFLRLYPLYFSVGVMILLVEGLISFCSSQPFGMYEVWNEPHCVTLFSAFYYVLVNLTILGSDSLWFLSQDVTTGRLHVTPYSVPHATSCINYIVNLPTWTLAVEMTFYLVAPFLVRKPVLIQTAFALASFALRWVLYLTLGAEKSFPWTYFFSPSLLVFFMVGSIGYHFYRGRRTEFEKFAATHAWIFWVFGAFILVENRMPYRDFLPYLFMPAVSVMVPLLFAYTRAWKTDRLIGELSYPYYLLHFHVIVILESILGNNHNALFGPLCAAGTFGLAWVFYQLIEIRSERYRERLFERIHPSKDREAKLPSSLSATASGTGSAMVAASS